MSYQSQPELENTHFSINLQKVFDEKSANFFFQIVAKCEIIIHFDTSCKKHRYIIERFSVVELLNMARTFALILV